MRQAGRISSWNDDKGYGFVVPHDGGDRAFVHVRAFQSTSRRPVEGDLISYATTQDARGRRNAVDVRFAGQRNARQAASRSGRSARLPRMALGAVALASVALGALIGAVPVLMAVAYVLLSGLSFLMYWFDKEAAQGARQRVPENSLHLVDLLGGWPGALIAQQRFRHKTAKKAFQVVFWGSVIANLALATWLVRSGFARTLTDALLGT